MTVASSPRPTDRSAPVLASWRGSWPLRGHASSSVAVRSGTTRARGCRCGSGVSSAARIASVWRALSHRDSRAGSAPATSSSRRSSCSRMNGMLTSGLRPRSHAWTVVGETWRRSAPTGLTTKSTAPAHIAATTVSMEPLAVCTMTGLPISRSRNAASTPMPSSPGMLRSSTMASIASPSGPVNKVTAAWPSSTTATP